MREVPRSALVGVLAAALVLRLLLFTGIQLRNPRGFFETDSHGYWQIAGNLLDHEVFSREHSPPYLPDHRRTPVYPVFLAMLRGIGLGAPGVVAVQILLSTATCWVVIRLTQDATGDGKAAGFAGAFVALDIPLIALSNSLLTETLFVFLLVAGVRCLLLHLQSPGRRMPLLGAGLLTGSAILCRPILAYFPLLLALFYVLGGRPGRSAALRFLALFMVPCLLLVGAWLARNALAFGVPSLSSVSAETLLYQRAAPLHAAERGLPLLEAKRDLFQQAKESFGEGWARDPGGFQRHQKAMALAIIRAHPFQYLRHHAYGTLLMFWKPMRSILDRQLALPRPAHLPQETTGLLFLSRLSAASPPTLALLLVQGVLLTVLWISAASGWRGLTPPASWLLAAPIAYFCLIGASNEPYARFRAPVLPFAAVAAGLGASRLLARR